MAAPAVDLTIKLRDALKLSRWTSHIIHNYRVDVIIAAIVKLQTWSIVYPDNVMNIWEAQAARVGNRHTPLAWAP